MKRCTQCLEKSAYVELHKFEENDYEVSLCKKHLSVLIKFLLDSVNHFTYETTLKHRGTLVEPKKQFQQKPRKKKKK